MTYSVTNTQGTVVATVAPGTTSGATFPIELIGLGVPDYRETIANTQYRLLENFTGSTAPANPIEGMVWFDNTANILTPAFYDGTSFQYFATMKNNAATLFPMEAGATSVDFTVAGDTDLVINNLTGTNFYPTMILIEPDVAPTAVSQARIQIWVDVPEDVMESFNVGFNSEKEYQMQAFQGNNRRIEPGEIIRLRVQAPAAGGVLTARVRVFGFSA